MFQVPSRRPPNLISIPLSSPPRMNRELGQWPARAANNCTAFWLTFSGSGGSILSRNLYLPDPASSGRLLRL